MISIPIKKMWLFFSPKSSSELPSTPHPIFYPLEALSVPYSVLGSLSLQTALLSCLVVVVGGGLPPCACFLVPSLSWFTLFLWKLQLLPKKLSRGGTFS